MKLNLVKWKLTCKIKSGLTVQEPSVQDKVSIITRLYILMKARAWPSIPIRTVQIPDHSIVAHWKKKVGHTTTSTSVCWRSLSSTNQSQIKSGAHWAVKGRRLFKNWPLFCHHASLSISHKEMMRAEKKTQKS